MRPRRIAKEEGHVSPAICPPYVTQFRRHWTAGGAAIKVLSGLSGEELDRLAIERGERILRRLPAWLTKPLTAAERRDLARAFGKPALRQAQGGAV